MGGVGSLVATYMGLLVLMTAGAAALKANVRRFILGIHRRILDKLHLLDHRQLRQFRREHAGRYAEVRDQLVAAADRRRWFCVALIVGLIVGNFLPRLAAWMKEAIRPEMYIKIAIVLLGGFLGIVSAEKLSLATR